MKILVCIDDTDNIDSRGTGEIAEILAGEIEKNGWGKSKGVTRHQLLVHPDIPYTSHNSSMCFPAEIHQQFLKEIIAYASKLLDEECAEGSDPGLCIVVLDRLIHQELLIDFGRRAKKQVLTKREAYSLAELLEVHLSEHGGTGQGIIGALAGAGLRLTGNDGRFKGNHKISSLDNVVKVKEIFMQTDIEIVKTTDGEVLKHEEDVLLGEKVKSVLLGGKSVLLVCPAEDNSKAKWQTCPAKSLKQY